MTNLYRFSLFCCLLVCPLAMNAETSERLPAEIDPERHYLFYLHGAIVEGSGGTPNHPDYGIYKYPEIVEKLEGKGFRVISEIRKKNTNPSAYANLISFYVDQLKEEGVPSSNITIVGESKGGIMACYVSNKQKDKDVSEQRIVITRERWGHRLIFEPWDRWVNEVVA